MNRTAIFTFNVRSNKTFKLGKTLHERGYPVFFVKKDSVKQIEEISQFPKVLGLGDFMKTAKRMRLESKTINKYGKQAIIGNGFESLPLFTGFITNTKEVYVSKSITNGPCNFVSYKVATLHLLPVQNVAFLHVPSSFLEDKALTIIENLLRQWR